MSPGFANAWQHKALALLIATQLGGCGAMLGAGISGAIAGGAIGGTQSSTGTHGIPEYAISESNVSAFRSARRAVELGEVTRRFPREGCSALGVPVPGHGPTECARLAQDVYCRSIPIKPEVDVSLTQYFQAAFNDELVAAGTPASPGRTIISMTLQKIEVDCGISSASWTVEVIVRVGDHAPYTVKTVRSFDGNFIWGIVLHRAEQAFMPTVQQTIAEIVQHPTFRAEYGLDM